jgi:hypothetical protein
MIKTYRVRNQHSDEQMSLSQIEALKRLDAITFTGTQRLNGARVFFYTTKGN